MNEFIETTIRHIAEEESRNKSGTMTDSLEHLVWHTPCEAMVSEEITDVRPQVAVYSCVSGVKGTLENTIRQETRKCCRRAIIHADWDCIAAYVDVGLFRREDERPEFSRMMEDAAAGKFEMIVTYNIGRFVRSSAEMDAVFKRLKELKMPVYFELQRHFSTNLNEKALRLAAKMEEREARRKSEAMRKSIEMR